VFVGALFGCLFGAGLVPVASSPDGGRCGLAFAATGVAVALGESLGLRGAGAAAVGRAPEEPGAASGRGVGLGPEFDTGCASEEPEPDAGLFDGDGDGFAESEFPLGDDDGAADFGAGEGWLLSGAPSATSTGTADTSCAEPATPASHAPANHTNATAPNNIVTGHDRSRRAPAADKTPTRRPPTETARTITRRTPHRRTEGSRRGTDTRGGRHPGQTCRQPRGPAVEDYTQLPRNNLDQHHTPPPRHHKPTSKNRLGVLPQLDTRSTVSLARHHSRIDVKLSILPPPGT
jgi:hypothetical protein